MNDLANLITAKAIQSKMDNRMASFVGIDMNDNVTLDLERIGRRTFPLGMVQAGFVFHMDNDSLIKGYLQKKGVRSDRPVTDKEVHEAAQDVFTILSGRFKDLKHIECYKSIREYCAQG